VKLLVDSGSGILRWAVQQPGEVVVVDEQECADLLRANARDADVDQRGRQFRLAARIPMSVIQQAAREGWLDDKERWKKWLNDSQNRAHRVWGGKL